MVIGGRGVTGAYRPGQTFIHRLDPRTKLCALLALSAAAMAAPLPRLVFLAALPPVGSLLIAGASRRMAAALRGFTVLFFFSAAVQLAFTPGDILWRGQAAGLDLAVTRQGVENAALITLRLFTVAAAAFLAADTTSPRRLGDAVVRLLGPLRRLGLPLDDIGLAFAVGLQFLPRLAQEAAEIRDAQISRGIGHLDRNPLRRLAAAAALLAPLVVRTLDRSRRLSLAMVSRGYGARPARSSLYPLRFGAADAVFAGSALLAFLLLLAAGYIN